MKTLVLGGITEGQLLATEVCRDALEQMVRLLGGGDGGGCCDVLLVDRQRQRLAHLES